MAPNDQITVFYAWQSDLPNATNRGFIQQALENAAKAIRQDESIQIDPVIDRDTLGIPGSPSIDQTIFAKIERSAVFVCDVSVINRKSRSRKTPNPNVLIELGYALKVLGSERVLLVMNTAFGKPDSLPFDLRQKRVITYSMPEVNQDRASERKGLEQKLEQALRSVVEALSRLSIPSSGSAIQSVQLEDKVKELLSHPSHRIELDDLVGQETTKTQELLSDDSFSMQVPTVTPEALSIRLKQYESTIRDLQTIVVLLAKWATLEHRPLLEGIFARMTDIERNTSGINIWLGLRWYPAIVLLYSAGISAVSANDYENLAALLTKRAHYDSGYRGRRFEEREIVLSIVDAMLHLDQANTFQRLPGHERQYTPRSEYLFRLLQPDLQDLLLLGRSYEATFDRFEILLAIVHADIFARKQDHPNFRGPLGRFAWKHRNSYGDPSVFTDFLEEATSQRDSWPPLQAGLFDGSYQRFEEVASGFSQTIGQVNWH